MVPSALKSLLTGISLESIEEYIPEIGITVLFIIFLKQIKYYPPFKKAVCFCTGLIFVSWAFSFKESSAKQDHNLESEKTYQPVTYFSSPSPEPEIKRHYLDNWWENLTPEWRNLLEEYVPNHLTQYELLNQITQLEELDLTHQNLSHLEPLAELKNLKRLVLKNNRISDLSPLIELNELVVLDLENNQISDISPLIHLNNLAILNLSYNRIYNIEALDYLKQLTFLNLSNNRIEEIWYLDQHSRLKYLDLSNNRIREFFHLYRLTQLIQLNILNNPVEHDLAIRDLKKKLFQTEIIQDKTKRF